MFFDFREKIVLITGGARGIGRSAALMFARQGATVVVNYRENRRAAEIITAELEKLHGDALVMPADLQKRDEVEQMLAMVRRNYGALDVLVNNAGIWVPTPVLQPDENRDRTLDINLRGLMNITEAAVPLLKESNGVIVNVASTAGQRGEAGYSAYAASKGAVISYTKSLAVELAPEVRVNCVAPGWVKTDMTAAAMAEREAELAAEIPLKRIAEPDDIAEPILFLASSSSRFINGEILNVNGGSVLCG